MRKIVIGAVCEGRSDFFIVEWCLGQALRNAKIDASFISIQPSRDKTSGTFSDGGWRQVYQWCMRNDRNSRRRYFEGGLFDDPEDEFIDILLIQIDGDIVTLFAENGIWADLGVQNPEKFLGSVDGIVEYCHSVIGTWLEIEDGERTTVAPTIRSSEAWLLAAANGMANAEQIDNPKQEFARFWHQVKGKKVPDDLRKLSRNFGAIMEVVESCGFDVGFMKDNVKGLSFAFDSVRARI